ncbi:hypothetical protein [Rhizobium sp. CCGE 510]|uniref:hypothetical protein n=1 Tax=Rhizobium sp. CCGE 510 TaxID=1132836 RepID=UPI00027B8B71|nr:hypothetical protein [Rhizobium sp. CCGE 510]EJT01461.1 hypothetical protein RCCGE510_29461 [Rhizobium sp. CCGE 510]
MSDEKIHRDSRSAWRSLSAVGGLEPSGRDQDLADDLKRRLNPDASNLDAALANVPLAEFVSALLASIQPFASMFKDILSFFETSGARFGQGQWKLAVGDDLVELSHFEEFLETWAEVDFDIDVPALDREHAFAFNSLRWEIGGSDYLRSERPDISRSAAVGIPDVDEWLAAYRAGKYLPLPDSLAPERQPLGLDDAARVTMAALHVIKQSGLSQEEMREQHRARHYQSDASDAFHPWTVAQSETDYWLESHVRYLGNLLKEPADQRKAFGARLAEVYSTFDRRRFSTKLDIRTLERILSLPAWKRRYEFFGVWVGTRIVDAFEGHEIRVNHAEGVLSFAFSETRLAEIASSIPLLSLFTERWTPLSDPIGKSRKAGVQPDFSMWTKGPAPSECPLVIEVKHYKKESVSNFGAALSDYARAHPKAKVILVNYGPMKADYIELLGADKTRCVMLGHFNPDSKAVCLQFRDMVRVVVGEPFVNASAANVLGTTEAVALDVSASMSSILGSAWFQALIGQPEYEELDFYLIDKEIRGKLRRTALRDWIVANQLGSATSLAASVEELLAAHSSLTVITDDDGADSLMNLRCQPIELEGCPPGVRLLRLAGGHR